MQTPARAGCDFLRRRWYRVFAPEVDPPCLRASPVREAWPRWLRPYHRLLQNGTTLGSLARLERLLLDQAILTTFWCVWLSPRPMESPPECEDGPRLKTRTTVHDIARCSQKASY